MGVDYIFTRSPVGELGCRRIIHGTFVHRSRSYELSRYGVKPNIT